MKWIAVLLFQRFCSSAALILMGLLVSGCGSGCPYISQESIRMINTLPFSVSVTFRGYQIPTVFTETLAAGEARDFVLANEERKSSVKAGVIEALCDEGVERRSGAVEFSSTTLTQYMVCDVGAAGSTSSVALRSVSIMALTDICPGTRVDIGY